MKNLRTVYGAMMLVLAALLALDGVALALTDLPANQPSMAPSEQVEEVALQELTRSFLFNREEVELGSNQGFDTVVLKGCEFRADTPGTPWLPAHAFMVEVPHGSGVERVSIQATEIKIADGLVLFPVQPECAPSKPVPPFMEPDATVYAQQERFPAESGLQIGAIHHGRGKSFVSLRINPLRYVPATGELYLATEIHVVVAYVEPAVLSAPEAASDEEEMEEGASFAPGDVDYLCITSAEMTAGFQVLANHRASHNGFSTEVLTVDWIANNYSQLRPDGGSDVQTAIRNCISDYVSTKGTVYVLLGGGVEAVPHRHFPNVGDKENPCDLYYSALDGTWDTDADGVYAEENAVDEMDWIPDVRLGRIPATTVDEALAYINKLINYETNPPYDKLTKAMGWGRMTFHHYYGDHRPSEAIDDDYMQCRDENHPMIIDSELWMRVLYRDVIQPYWEPAEGFHHLHDSLTEWDSQIGGDYFDASGHEVERFGEGYQFITMMAHGNPWGLGGFEDEDAAAMTELVPMMFSGGCETGGFHHDGSSLAQELLLNPEGGCLMFHACSTYGSAYMLAPDRHWGLLAGGASMDQMRSLLSQIYEHKITDIGEAFVAHKTEMVDKSRSLHLYINLLGDPALEIFNPLGIKVDAKSVNVPEGGSASFQVKLTMAPESSKTISVVRSGGDSSIWVSGGASLVFDASNWNVYQTVTLSANQDSDSTEGVAQIECSVAGAPLTAMVAATEFDDEHHVAPVVSMVSPRQQTVRLASAGTLALEGLVEEDGRPGGGVTVLWTKTHGPSGVVFSSPNALSSQVEFSANGTYLLRLTASDGALEGFCEIQVVVGASEYSLPSADGLIAHYQFDESNGTSATDLAGGDHPATLSTPQLWAPDAGVWNGALSLNGEDSQYAYIPSAPAFSGTVANRTVAFWFKANEFIENPVYVEGEPYSIQQTLYDEAGDSSISIYLDGDVLYVGNSRLGGDPNKSTYLHTPFRLEPNRWYHVAVTLDASDPNHLDAAFRGYLDGEEFAVGEGGVRLANSEAIGIGGAQGKYKPHYVTNWENTPEFNGFMDEFVLYNRTLSATQIRNLRDALADSTPADLRVYLSDLDWTSATTGWGDYVRKDLSIDDNPLTLDGTTYAKGLGTHANSEIVYDLSGGSYATFHAALGIDDETPSGSVTFKVYGDGVLLYTSAELYGSDAAVLIDIDVTGIQTLKLVADGGGNISADHADWADAYLYPQVGEVVPNQAPTAQDAAFSIAENSALGTSVGTVSATDPEGDTLTYSITAGNSTGTFAIDSATGEITLAGAVDREATASYALTISVSDTKLSDTATLAITITDVPNDDSDADGLDDAWELLHFGSTTAETGTGDADSDGVTNAQEEALGSDPNDPAFPGAEYAGLSAWWNLDETSGAVAVDSSVNGLDATAYNGVLVGQSGQDGGAFGFDGLDDFAATQGTIAPGSDLTIVAWIHPSALLGEQTILAKEDAFALKLSSSSIRLTTPGKLDHSGSGSFTANEWQFVAVTFTPSATGGCRFYRNGTLLNAVDSSDINQNGNPLLLAKNQWGQYFEGSLDHIRLYDRVLTDAEIDALYQQNVVVQNQAPVALDDAFAVAENSAIGTSVGTVSATDPEGDALAYSITAGNATGTFAINSATGEITLAGAVDREATASYALTISVSDGALSDTAAVSVSVSNVNEAPVASNESGTVAEDASVGTLVATVSATDPDAGDTLTYSLVDSFFAIDSVSGAITVAAPLDYETASSHSLVVTVTDSGGLADTATVTITVTSSGTLLIGQWDFDNANDLTAATVGADLGLSGSGVTAMAGYTAGDGAVKILPGSHLIATHGIAPNGGGSMVNEWSVLIDFKYPTLDWISFFQTDPSNSDDGDCFVHTSSGALGLAATGYGSPGTATETWHRMIVSVDNGTHYKIYLDGVEHLDGTAQALDARFGLASTLLLFADENGDDGEIHVSSVRMYNKALTPTEMADLGDLGDVGGGNSAPTAQDGSFTVAENSAIGTSVGTVSATDPEGDTLAYSITAGNASGTFAIDSATGEITLAGAVDREATASYALTISVSDGALSDTAAVSVSVSNVNEAPVASNGSGSVAEDALVGTLVATVSATDPDAGDTLTYSLVDSFFAIDSASGEITVAAPLDYDTASSHSLVVTVTDSGGLSDTASVVVNVSEVSAGTTPPTGDLVVYYPMDATSGSTVLDAEGGDHSGTLTGGTWNPSDGAFNGSLGMDGVDDAILIPNASDINLMTVNNRTIALWFRADALADGTRQMLYEEGGNAKGINLHLDGAVLRVGAWPGNGFLFSGSLQAGRWYHVALTLDAAGSKMIGYLDGVQFDERAYAAVGSHSGAIGLGVVQVATKTYALKKLTDPSNFGGDLDEFVLYNRTLSAAEIMELSFGGGIGPSALSEPQESPYEDWTEQEFAPEEMATAAVKLDADNDQLPNLLEYALVLDPQEANPTPIGQSMDVQGTNEWVVEFALAPTRDDVDIVLEWSASLNPVDWRTIAESLAGGPVEVLNGGVLVSESGDDPTIVQVAVPGASGKGFIQWRVIKRR